MLAIGYMSHLSLFIPLTCIRTLAILILVVALSTSEQRIRWLICACKPCKVPKGCVLCNALPRGCPKRPLSRRSALCDLPACQSGSCGDPQSWTSRENHQTNRHHQPDSRFCTTSGHCAPLWTLWKKTTTYKKAHEKP
jgi:hypothetical protein